MKKNLLALAIAALAGVAQAQTSNTPKTVLWQYNLNQAGGTPIYCALSDKVSTFDRVTASASTTLTAVSGAPFTNVRVGAMLHFVDLNGTDFRRTVTVRNSATSVVVSGASLTATSALIQPDSQNVSCGTGATAGWFDVSIYNKFDVQVEVGQQVNTGGIQFHLQCRASGEAQAVQQYPALTFPTVASSYTPALTGVGPLGLGTSDPFFQCRVGMFIVTADDGNDLTTNAEQVTITIIGRP